MPTPLSGASAYCTAAQFLQRYDARRVGQLLSDTTVPLSPPEVLTSTVLASLLKQSAGEIESACIVGNRYSPADLAALTGNSLEYLIGLNAGLVMATLWDRRGAQVGGDMPRSAQLAVVALDQLSKGGRIFGLVAQADAGSEVILPARTNTDNRLVTRANRYLGELDI